ncbi:MAG TPA: oligosaccharide flippase family protein, partial [Saprospiraceae bacterium]|nr:oligosaccharide flippase family protein [Saprospiraceae bacterium]
LLLDKLSTPMQVSAFGASLRVQSALIFLPTVFSAIIAPEITRLFASKNLIQARQLVHKGVRMLLVFAGALAFGVTTVPDLTIRILFGGETYKDIAPMIVLLSWAFVGIAYSFYIVEVAIAEGKQWVSMVYMLVSMVVSVSLDFALIPIYGAYGASWARFVSILAASLTVWQLTRTMNSIARNQHRSFLFRFCMSIGVGFIVHYVCSIYELHDLLDGLLTVSIYLITTFILGLVNTNDMRLLLPNKIQEVP